MVRFVDAVDAPSDGDQVRSGARIHVHASMPLTAATPPPRLLMPPRLFLLRPQRVSVHKVPDVDGMGLGPSVWRFCHPTSMRRVRHRSADYAALVRSLLLRHVLESVRRALRAGYAVLPDPSGTLRRAEWIEGELGGARVELGEEVRASHVAVLVAAGDADVDAVSALEQQGKAQRGAVTPRRWV